MPSSTSLFPLARHAVSLTVAAVLLLVGMGAAPLHAQANAKHPDGPPLRETLEWLQGAIPDMATVHDSLSLSSGHSTRYSFSIIALSDSCSLALTRTLRLEGYDNFTARDSVAIPLGNLDLLETRILATSYFDLPPTVSPERPGIRIVTRMTGPPMTLTRLSLTGSRSDHQLRRPKSEAAGDGVLRRLSVLLSSSENAERIHRGLVHAARLCGASVDPF